MEFKKEDFENLEKLARIKCTEEEKKSLLKDLQKILSYMEKLKEVDTTDVPPCNFVLKDLKNVYRKDEKSEKLDTHLFLENAPDKISNMIKIPPVMEG